MKAFCLILSLISTVSLRGQDISELTRRNGFKDIKLGSAVDSVNGATFEKDIIELKEFDAKQYEVNNPAYEKIGEAEVNSVELKTYKGLIYEIIVTTSKDPRIMRGLEKSYGKATYNIRTETYNWHVPKQISLIYKGKNKKEVTLTYRSYPVVRLMYADKKKKIEEIAEDF
jgi:hypothetical protein